jgi:hypothetical protein
MALGPRFFNDSDGIIVPPGGSLKLVELAPNVQHVQGGTANNLIVAMKDGLVILDAPYGDLQSRWVIEAAKAKYPGKPIKYLAMTHLHMDHSGGARAFVAEALPSWSRSRRGRSSRKCSRRSTKSSRMRSLKALSRRRFSRICCP